MRVLLLAPIWSYTQRYLPVNLAELAGFIRDHGYKDVQILDLNDEVFDIISPEKKFEAAKQLVLKAKPDIIGISCQTINVPFCLKFSQLLKASRDVPIVLGGIHPSFRAKEMFALCQIDYIVRGEGEVTLLELLDCLTKKPAHKSLNQILGLSYKQGHQIHHNPDRPLIKDLADLAPPAYDLLKAMSPSKNKSLSAFQRLFRQTPTTEIVGSVIASRGCPYRCLFCSSNHFWRYQRRKPIKNIIKEIKYQKQHLETNKFMFEDDCLTLNRQWSAELFKALKELRVRWGCLTRIDLIETATIKAMKAAGCTSIYHGIEAGNNKMRKVLDKKNNPKLDNNLIIKLVKEEVRHKIKPTCSFMVGIPSETKKDFADTVNLAFQLKQIGAEIQLWIMTPYPDTPAIRIFKHQLRKMDRWVTLRQGDVFIDEQILLFHDILDQMPEENPDNYIFMPDMGLAQFLNQYEKALAHLGLGQSYLKVKGCFIYNYFSCNDQKIHFVSFQKKEPINQLAASPKTILLKIEIDRSDLIKLANKLITNKIRACFLSVSCPQRHASTNQRQAFAQFLCQLIVHKIDFTLTKPLPPTIIDGNLKPLLKQAIFCPTSCQDCLELFRVSNDKVHLCGGQEIGRVCVFQSRRQLFELFKSAHQDPKNQQVLSCCQFPDPRPQKQLSLSLRAGYTIPPDAELAKIVKKTPISQLLNSKNQKGRFQNLLFLPTLNELQPNLSAPAQQSHIVFLKSSEEIHLLDNAAVGLLKHLSQSGQAKDLVTGLYPKQGKLIINKLKELVAWGIIIDPRSNR